MWVYVHTCPNGKRYVGQTIVPVEKRWRKGFGYKSHNKHFFRAITKYGWDNIDHTIYQVNSKEEMDYLEKYLIAFYNTTDHNCGYNKTIGGEGVVGFKHSEEAKHKMSELKNGIHYPTRQSAVIRTDQNGNEYRYSSIQEAAKAINSNTGNICNCLKGKRKTAGGYKWRYES